MRFIEVSTVDSHVLQEWHCGCYALLACATEAPDRFKVQFRRSGKVLKPEFVVGRESMARLAARYLLRVFESVIAPSDDELTLVLRAFASVHGWQQSPFSRRPDLAPIRPDKSPFKTRILKKAFTTEFAESGDICKIVDLESSR